MLYFAPWKTALVLLVVLAGALFAAPNLLTEQARDNLPGFVPNNAVNLGLDLQGGSYLLYQVDTSAVRQSELEIALERAPGIARDEGCDEPGAADNPALFCPILTSQAVLGDYATLRVSDLRNFDEALSRLRSELPQPETGNVLGGQPRHYTVEPGDGPGEIRIEVTEDYMNEVRRRTIGDSIEIIRRRIDALGTSEAQIQRQGVDRIVIQAPGVQDPEELERLVGTTAQMTFHLAVSDPQAYQNALEGVVRPSQMLVPQQDPLAAPLLVERYLRPADSARDPNNRDRLVRTLSGDYFRASGASLGFHPQTGEPVVNFSFNNTGAVIFGKLTTNHTGESFAVVLDGVVITAPRMRVPITGGSGFIEGGFTVQSATELASLLNAGALPAPLERIDRQTVSATLGADSVAAGRTALIIGFAGVIVFMLLAYGLFGVISNTALLVNVVLILGALSGLGAALTLPGIAGIILTIGMAVDANVLIFERIREEIRSGRTPANAIETGYSRALSAILDANITTLIAAVLLFQFGSGPVRGFAVTLAIGIVTSVFTAFVFSRFLISLWFKSTRPRALPI
ncbi:MAG: protein translocase subunit SecD [Maricaulaceae bacterium]|jgi:preprotein translocase subunit SecD